MFNLIGDYSMDEKFLVDHICITSDKIAELKIAACSSICYVMKSFCCGIVHNFHDCMNIDSVLVDILQPTKVILQMLDCFNSYTIKSDLTYPLCLSQHMLHFNAIDKRFTYICKLSCILYTLSYGHDSIPISNTYQSSAVKAWYPTYRYLPILDWFDLVYTKFDHRSSVRTLELLLNNKTIYIYVFLILMVSLYASLIHAS